MTPDDPRHGTVAGFVAHRRAGSAACEPCLTAKRRYEKRRRINGPLKVPALGTRRRIQALRRLGHTLNAIADAAGYDGNQGRLHDPLHADTITQHTADAIARAYDQLSMTLATGPKANRVRLLAERQGWPPPLAWDDIDNDPAPAAVRRVDWRQDPHTDDAAVDRRLDGDLTVQLSRADRAEVVRRARRAGRTFAEIEQQYAINKPERYLTSQQEAS